MLEVYFYSNPDNDLALANGDENYNTPSFLPERWQTTFRCCQYGIPHREGW